MKFGPTDTCLYVTDFDFQLWASGGITWLWVLWSIMMGFAVFGCCVMVFIGFKYWERQKKKELQF